MRPASNWRNEMNSQLVAIMAHIAACNARIAAMTAANDQRKAVGNSMAYTEDHFWSEANQLDFLAIEARNAI